MKKLFYLSFIVLLFSINLNAQIEKHVKWELSTQKVNETDVWLIYKATIDEGWHLYSPHNPPGGALPLEIIYEDEKNFKKIGKITETPKATEVYDDIFEKIEMFFEHEATFKQKIRILSEKDFTINLTLDGQVCLENGRCIAFSEDYDFAIKGVPQENTNNDTPEDETPEDEVVDEDTLLVDVDSNVTEIDTVNNISLERGKTTPIIVSENKWIDSDEKQTLIWFFLVALGLGFMALLTPCVFPMVPMTVSFFMKGDGNKVKNRINALVYGISIIVVYTLPIAIIVGIANLGGEGSISADFANFLSTHWLPNIFFFLIFVIFAASFFGMFEITLPSWLVNKSDKQASKGGFLGIFFMAFTLVLVSFSCTGPIVGGILVESTQGGSIIKPLIGMLGFSLGIAIPFTLFAFFPSVLNKLPKSGGWLNSIKVVLGFIELALGLKFLSIADQTYHWGILDREVYIAIWIVIFGLMGLYLIGKIKFAHDSEIKHIKVPRLIFAILTFSFVVYLIPGMIGAPLKPLSGYLPPKSTHDFDIAQLIKGDQHSTICEKPKYADQLHLPHGLEGYYEVYQALNCSKENNKPIFIDFTGHGCVNCRQMEANVWSDPRVLKILNEDYIVLSLYVDDKTVEAPSNRWFTSSADGKTKKYIGKQNADIQVVNFGIVSQPLYALVDFDGNVLAPTREFDTDIEAYIEFLENGKEQYKLLHPMK